MANKLKILVESRIRGNVYVRFGGEYMETYYSNITRHRVLSLHYVVTQPFILQLCCLMNLTLKTTDAENESVVFSGIPDYVQAVRLNNRVYEIN